MALVLSLMRAPQAEALDEAAQRGLADWTRHRYALAIDALRQSLSLNPNQPLLRYYLADALYKSRRLREAQLEYQWILAAAPDSQAARLAREALLALREPSRRTSAGASKTATAAARGKRAILEGPDMLAGLSSGGSEDYLADILENGRLVRWSVLQQPLLVWVDRNPQGIRNFQPAFVASVSRAMNTWVQALDGRLRYEMTDSREDADIWVTWVNTIDATGQTTESGTAYHAGVTVPEIQAQQLRRMEIRMATFDIAGRPQDARHIEAVMLHEVGHAMGLLGHSDDPRDIMFGRNQLSFTLSRRDLATFRRLYGEMADVTSLPPPSEDDPELRDAEAARVAKRLDDQIAKQEALATLQHDNLSMMNLGNAYFAKGKALADKAKREGASLPAEAVAWFGRAVDVISQGIKLDPRSPFGYYNRSVAYQEMRQDDKALVDLNQAMKLDPRDPKLYREKAWVLAKLKQPAEAREALKVYLAKEPYKADSQEVKRIQALLNSPPP